MEREHRVTYGGLFHSHKVQYSKETQNLLNRLIEESKLSILQRQALKNSVKNGEPLPGPERGNSASKGRGQGMTGRGEVLVPPALPRRRSYQAIVRSGAYQRDTFHPPYNSNMKDREEEKQKLQSLMTYGKNLPPDPSSLKTSRLKQRAEEEEFDADTLFDHLVEEIKERLEFLQEMERLGEAKAYQDVIEQEIAAKMRQMANINRDKFVELSSKIDKKAVIAARNKPLKNSFSLENNIFPCH
ncbi:UPF0193 protein EVG1 homolog [Homalodisca vitripennis]|uniref:UPF0193 protein EVG1 homolog n=1 Tax=Homalodisca vitripennis TaxID=197043 RepID=UPI001EEA32CB|nr:UPF0193 protein EVG1 homolog [Homalodisca vitripennis]